VWGWRGRRHGHQEGGHPQCSCAEPLKGGGRMAGEEYTCEMCGARFGSKAELDKHVETVHAGTPTKPAKTGKEAR